MKGKVHTK